MPAPLAIPAWAIISMIGASTAGSALSAKGASDANDAAMKQRNKEFLAEITLKNKQLDINQDQFRQQQKMKNKAAVESGPNRLMSTLSTLDSLGQQPASTADKLKFFMQ